jgi:YMGG-like Gly-zipper
MKWTRLTLTIVLPLTTIVCGSHAQAQTYSPAKGQSAEQQSKDTGECHTIAVQQSGFDPTQAQPAASPAPQQGGERARGAARGAAVGAAAGAIGGDAGKGAAAGAAAGTVAGGVRKREAGRQQEAQAEQQQAAAAQGKAGYDKALAGCMQGKGYGVK